MPVQKIILEPDPVLHQKSEKVKSITPEIKALIQDLIDTAENAKDPEAAGLSAPQLGVLKRVILARNFFKDPKNPHAYLHENVILINPKIISASTETDLEWEGCLSIPDTYGKVRRPVKVKVDALDETGERIRLKATGYFARIVQHEIDHINGILFTERVEGKTLTEKELDQLEESNE